MSQAIEKLKKDILGIIFIGVTVFLALMLGTYRASDPSFNSTGRLGAVHNFCGLVGSYLADGLYQIFGVTAWGFAVLALVLGLRTFRRGHFKLSSKLIPLVLFALSVSGLLALHGKGLRVFDNSVPLGGVVGLGMENGLTRLVNYWGAAVVLWSAFLVSVVWFTERGLGEFLSLGRQTKRLVASFAILREKIFKMHLFPEVASNALRSEEQALKQRLVGKKMSSPDEVATETSAKDQANLENDGDSPSMVPSLLKKLEIRAPIRLNRNIEPRRQITIENWELPKLNLLEDPPSTRAVVDKKILQRNVETLEDKLTKFSVKGKVVAVKPGPAVTMYEFKPEADVRVSKITELENDLALALSAESLRIIAPLPGRDVVGIEGSNPERETVFMRESLEDPPFWDEKIKLPVVMGKKANGEPRVSDLRKMPHLLVAGTTGSGKSVFVTSMITGFLFRHSPKTLRLIVIDPKQVDLAPFYKVPHLCMPPVTDARKAVLALKWAVREMDKRYRSMAKFGSRGLEGYNEVVEKLNSSQREEHERINQEHMQANQRKETYYYQALPYIVIVVEEFADLMVVDKCNVEPAVQRLTQMARACGMHLVLATQSPRKDVVTGIIKTNIPGRISFKVASKMDSRIILDESGAERLLARGDMLFLEPGSAKPERHHAAWLSEGEIGKVAHFWAAQGEPEYDSNALSALEGPGTGVEEGTFAEVDFSGDGEDADGGFDDRYDEILAWVSAQKDVSASLLQRRFKLGYPRAARLIEIFEKEQVIGPANGSKPRQVLVSRL